MKKRMFLSTILMTLVLLVAVTTATFAWYSASIQSSDTKVSLSTATNTAAGASMSVQLELFTNQGANIAATYTDEEVKENVAGQEVVTNTKRTFTVPTGATAVAGSTAADYTGFLPATNGTALKPDTAGGTQPTKTSFKSYTQSTGADPDTSVYDYYQDSATKQYVAAHFTITIPGVAQVTDQELSVKLSVGAGSNAGTYNNWYFATSEDSYKAHICGQTNYVAVQFKQTEDAQTFHLYIWLNGQVVGDAYSVGTNTFDLALVPYVTGHAISGGYSEIDPTTGVAATKAY